MLHVTKYVLQGDYTVYVEFNDGRGGTICFKTELERDHREIIRELLNLKKFNTVKLEYHTLCWDNGVDFAPEYLYEQVMKQKKAAYTEPLSTIEPASADEIAMIDERMKDYEKDPSRFVPVESIK
jgi:hypothetical protein